MLLLRSVAFARLHHGVRPPSTYDYARYRRYLSGRLKKLRSVTKHTQWLLFAAERAWAYFMDLKQGITPKSAHPTRILRHAKMRLRRATQLAEAALLSLNDSGSCTMPLVHKTSVEHQSSCLKKKQQQKEELQLYCGWIKALYFTENQEFTEAKATITAALALPIAVASPIVPAEPLHTLHTGLLEQLRNLLRLCP